MTQDNSDQTAFWTDRAGQIWAEQQEWLDRFMRPVLDGVIARAPLTQGQAVMDVGCGTGDSSLRASEIVGAGGHVLGVDISAPMLERARARATDMEAVEFALADAAHHTFESARFDHLISRFGVMFFADPEIAFSNLIKALRPGAHVTFACWGQIQANPWFTAAARAAKTVLDAPPAIDPDAPGPFAFRDTERVKGILALAGFEQIEAEVESCDLTPPGNPALIAQMATSIGPAVRALEHFNGDDQDRAAITDLVATAFQEYQTADGLRIPSEINYFTARAPSL